MRDEQHPSRPLKHAFEQQREREADEQDDQRLLALIHGDALIDLEHEDGIGEQKNVHHDIEDRGEEEIVRQLRIAALTMEGPALWIASLLNLRFPICGWIGSGEERRAALADFRVSGIGAVIACGLDVLLPCGEALGDLQLVKAEPPRIADDAAGRIQHDVARFDRLPLGKEMHEPGEPRPLDRARIPSNTASRSRKDSGVPAIAPNAPSTAASTSVQGPPKRALLLANAARAAGAAEKRASPTFG